MSKYYYLYHTKLQKGVNIKFSPSGALILYSKPESAQRAINYGLKHKYSEMTREFASHLVIKEIEL